VQLEYLFLQPDPLLGHLELPQLQQLWHGFLPEVEDLPPSWKSPLHHAVGATQEFFSLLSLLGISPS